MSEDEHSGSSERWLLTYSDMITLLLALFVILFALSDINHAKYAELKTDLHASFNGTNPSKLTSTEVSPTTVPPTTTIPKRPTRVPRRDTLAVIQAQLRQALTSAGLIRDVALARTPDSLTLGFIAGKTFYSTDSARLSPLGVAIVDVAGGVLRQHPNSVTVDGYTDNQRITGGPYLDNWQLSAARSLVVVEQLQHVSHVDPGQLYIVGLGQYHPVVPNTTPAQQAENRRVDIVVSPLGARGPAPTSTP